MEINYINFKGTPSKEGFYLVSDNWDDFGYKTYYFLYYFDGISKIDIGGVKIATKVRNAITGISELLRGNNSEYFSLGQSKEYYLNLNELGEEKKEFLLKTLKDIAYDLELFEEVKDFKITKTSLLRDIYTLNVKDQFNRIINNGAELTDYEFQFLREGNELVLDFKVDPNSMPPSNVHAIIGSNGVGKTTILKQMVETLLNEKSNNKFINMIDEKEEIFANVIFISFSAFDSGGFYKDQKNKDGQKFYSYIGLKEGAEDGRVLSKDLDIMAKEFGDSLNSIINNKNTLFQRWKETINVLETDITLRHFNLAEIDKYTEKEQIELFLHLSSGHKLIILTITRLIEQVSEKTLVLIDEPESHLHPPLLSAFMNALSKILIQQNGVCILATHSPVVMQELNRECVSVIRRGHEKMSVTRPTIDTYGENVGTLTREVFNLEVTNTGFYLILKESVKRGESYEEILDDFEDALGLEARTILRSLIKVRDTENIT